MPKAEARNGALAVGGQSWGRPGRAGCWKGKGQTSQGVGRPQSWLAVAVLVLPLTGQVTWGRLPKPLCASVSSGVKPTKPFSS